MKRNLSVIAWEGKSLVDGARIRVILTGLGEASGNAKTGAMVQSYIVRADRRPVDAINDGSDRSVCGDCPHRKGPNGRTCYVSLHTGLSVVGRIADGLPRVTPRAAARLINGRPLRIGTYGDPGAVPWSVWARLLQGASHWTGYTHMWRERPDLRPMLMASVDNHLELGYVVARGWRAFRVMPVGDTCWRHETLCPASVEAGHKVSCAQCGLCCGLGRKARNVAIYDHSSKANAAKRRLAVVV